MWAHAAYETLKRANGGQVPGERIPEEIGALRRYRNESTSEAWKWAVEKLVGSGTYCMYNVWWGWVMVENNCAAVIGEDSS